MRKQCDLSIAGEDMGLEVLTQSLCHSRGDFAGGNAVARPGHQGRDKQKHIKALAIFFAVYGEDTRFRERLSLFNQDLVPTQMGLRKMLERCIDRGVIMRAHQLEQYRRKLGFPITVLDTTARAVERERKRHQTRSISRQTDRR